MSLFVAGTGTEVGKTMIAAAVARTLGWQARKPVASGADERGADDPSILARATGRPAEATGLYRFAEPAAPHRAAAMQGVTMDWTRILDFCRGEALVIEGAGGLFSPLTPAHTNADLAAALNFPVLLVAGTYLGTLNHTLATLRAAHFLPVAGLVVSQSAAGETPDRIIEDLRLFGVNIPCLAVPRIVQPDPWLHVEGLSAWLGECGISG